MDAITANRFAAMTAVQGSAAANSSLQPGTYSFAECLMELGIDDNSPPKEILDLLKMLEELEEKDEKKKKKEDNAAADMIMEAIRAQQEKMNGIRDTRIVKDKSEEAKAISGQENADFRDSAAKGYLKSLKEYIKKKYNIA